MSGTEFSRPVRVDTIGSEPRRIALVAEASERDALAARFGLVALDSFEAEAELRRDARGIVATGRLEAKLAQACVVTGDRIDQSLSEPFELVFRPADSGADPGEEIELAADELDAVPIEGPDIDLGEAVAQTLGLAIDPYPRSERAAEALKAAGVKSEEEAGPFGALASLRDKMRK